jgi:fucose permease
VFWGFLAVVILYAFAEGTFANWCVIYLYEERGIPLPEASLALSVFWAALAGGRLLASAALLKVKTEHLWLLPPFLMIGAFALMPSVETAGGGLWAFAFAGLACSAFFPLCIAVATKRFPEREAMVASLLIAALMLGVGIGSFAIGPLRAYLPLERLYFWSAVYPAGVLLAVVSIVTGGRHSRKCSPVLGKTC